MKIIYCLILIISVFLSTASAQKTETTKDTSSSEEFIIEEDAPIFTIVDPMPQYPGGEEAMYTFISGHLKYPVSAKEQGISGMVIVTFVIEKNGSVSNVELLKDIGGGCGAEAVRVVKSMPKWKPGKQDRKPVRVQFSLPLNFSLSN